ncbi:hypothetical protein [Mycobacterium parmense]|uniref:Uncharacterized protein n=1 Tax=Mycobacterium parmense TaxID=185642 RepID=A0A7I7Z0F0_9MYCO|nr:hypothetical protein [Mycobacterium parmense]MCV7349987.1 hypothetical protein [Mycobacterium parmense]ORW59268.1 hypothetical protein AWC20_09995 [Mycobacterium parmense]BBZ46481.1 hypothetical protein MPRM_37620 [Mycobacterium parmense]
MSAITLPFEPAHLTFSAPGNKLYAIGIEGDPPVLRAYAVSLSDPPGPIKRFDTLIGDEPEHIVVNDRLGRGYALLAAGVLKVFSTDSDTVVSTSQKPSCYPQVLAINPASGIVYGGGISDKGECLVEFDSDGRIVADNDVAPNAHDKNPLVQRIAVDPGTGDVLYTNPSSVGRADHTLTEEWRTPVNGPGEINDLGFEPTTNTVYFSVGDYPVISATRISVLDGQNGKQRGALSGPGWGSGFAAPGDGRLFAAFYNSSDLYVLAGATSTMTAFAPLANIAALKPADSKYLELDVAGRRLFVGLGNDANKILVYRY